MKSNCRNGRQYFMMNYFLQISIDFLQFKKASLSFFTAFIATIIAIPPVISVINRLKLHDQPNHRKLHTSPVPTMGGIAVFFGLLVANLMWFPFNTGTATICFFFSASIIFLTGIMDDLKDLPAKYKFMIQLCLAFLIALSGIRITSLQGFLGIYELPVYAQYFFTILAIAGITNAFNLIDGIDGLAGGLGFMSLVTLGFFLTISGDNGTALIAFALAGGILAFLYFNLNPAKIFLGDTGSLLIGFVIGVLCIRLMQMNITTPSHPYTSSPVFVLGIVFIPVFDTVRVLALRTWKGESPFMADKIHIHHVLTNRGCSHVQASKLICLVNALLLLEIWALRYMRQEFILLAMTALLLVTVKLFRLWGRKIPVSKYFPTVKPDKNQEDIITN